MESVIATTVIGIVCILLGFANRSGNISSLHSYHRHRVSEEDRIPFGKAVGLGTIICGISCVIFSAFSAVAFYTETKLFSLIGTVILISGLALGLGISFYAMIKYNKGIF